MEPKARFDVYSKQEISSQFSPLLSPSHLNFFSQTPIAFGFSSQVSSYSIGLLVSLFAPTLTSKVRYVGPVWPHNFEQKCTFLDKNLVKQMFGSTFLNNFVFKTDEYLRFQNRGNG